MKARKRGNRPPAEASPELEEQLGNSRNVTLKSFRRGLANLGLLHRLLLRELGIRQQRLEEWAEKSRRSPSTRERTEELLRQVDLLLVLYLAPVAAELEILAGLKPATPGDVSRRSRAILREMLGSEHRTVMQLFTTRK